MGRTAVRPYTERTTRMVGARLCAHPNARQRAYPKVMTSLIPRGAPTRRSR